MINPAQPARRKISSFLHHKKGFTLIELLIVVAIIGILTTIVTANFVGVRQRARDATRKSDIRQIQSALELYRSDNGDYPVNLSTFRLTTAPCMTSGELASLEGTVYMKKVPCDPLGSASSVYYDGNYFYSSDGSAYNLAACIENTNDADPNIKSESEKPLLSADTCTTQKYFYVTDP